MTSVAKVLSLITEIGLSIWKALPFVTRERKAALLNTWNLEKRMDKKKSPRKTKRKTKWSFLDDMQVGESTFVTSLQEYENCRTAMRWRGFRYETTRASDGSGWRIKRIL